MKKQNPKNDSKNLTQQWMDFPQFPGSGQWIGNDYIFDNHCPKSHIGGKGITAEKWIQQIFNSKIAKDGGVARRKLSSIDKIASRTQVLQEVTKRGFHVIWVKDQWIFICNKGLLQIVQ